MKANLHAASFFGAFTTPQKLAIITAMLPEPINVTGIGRAVDLDQPMVSQILAQFRSLGIVRREKQGRCMVYQIKNPEAMRQLLAIADNF